jgi:peroxiredoxin
MYRIPLLLLFASLLLITGCTKSPSFEIKGIILHADGKTLYLEHIGLNATDRVDSVKLKESGTFNFAINLPESPEFYKLRVDKQFIYLSTDSARTITIKADGANLEQKYQITGSRACELIRELTLFQNKTARETDSLTNAYKQNQLTEADYRDSLNALFTRSKIKAKDVIYEDPLSPAAYMALFLKFHTTPLFNPFDVDDNKIYAAVATSWDTFYSKTERAKHLFNVTTQGLKAIKQARIASNIKIVDADVTSHFEITLPTITNKQVSLSSLKGSVVLLDFTVYQSDFSPKRNLYFRELYKTFHQKGLEIYQVSFDPEEHFWKISAANLPWICVRDESGANSELFKTFNVSKLPTYFLIDKTGSLVARDAQVSDLYKKIKELL